MHLILDASTFQKRLQATGPKRLALDDLPAYTRDHLGLMGLCLPTAVLAGLDAKAVDRFRDAADKASCPCLVLVESRAQKFSQDHAATDAAIERMLRVVQVAHRLGCNSTALAIEADDSADNFDASVDACQTILERADRLEMNLLIRPHAGLTASPDQATTLIKKIGGFRIGSMPDFQAASASGDAREYLRRITPYAQAVVAPTTPAGQEAAPLRACIAAILAVGFDGSLALEHRGKGDAEASILATRETLEIALRPAQKTPLGAALADVDLLDADAPDDEGED